MSDQRIYWRSSLCGSSRKSTRSESCMCVIMLVRYRPNWTLLLWDVSCSSRMASILSCRPAVEGKEEDFFFCRGGGTAGGAGMGTTSAVPSSLSSTEEELGPIAVASFAVSCNYKSTKHGLDKMNVMQKYMWIWNINKLFKSSCFFILTPPSCIPCCLVIWVFRKANLVRMLASRSVNSWAPDLR